MGCAGVASRFLQGGANMIQLVVYTNDSSALFHISSHETKELAYKSLWFLVKLYGRQKIGFRMYSLNPMSCIEQSVIEKDPKGVWRFTDGTPLRGPVVRTYWRVRGVKEGSSVRWSSPDKYSICSDASLLRKSGYRNVSVTRVTVRAKAKGR